MYQIYVRSFADSNGDGQGDLQGVIDHLDHLSWLGVDAIWLRPITPSPNADWGYDVADYSSVWTWKRGQISVAVNCSDLPVDIDVASGVVLIGTRRERDGRPVDGPLRLEPWEGVALAANDPDA